MIIGIAGREKQKARDLSAAGFVYYAGNDLLSP